MLIDWFTVGAQIFNFLILVILLKKFLYGPIVKAMDEREARIAGRLKEAEVQREEAEREAQIYSEKNRELDERRAEMLTQAKRESQEQKMILIENARREAEDKRTDWFEAIEREKHSFLQNLRNRACAEIMSIARRALSDLSDTHLEQRVMETFLQRLSEIERGRLQDLSRLPVSSGGEIVVRSTFEIDEQGKGRIIRAISDQIQRDGEVRFQTSPDLICGIEMKVDGHKIVWSLRNYLDSLESRLSDAFDRQSQEMSDSTKEVQQS